MSFALPDKDAHAAVADLPLAAMPSLADWYCSFGMVCAIALALKARLNAIAIVLTLNFFIVIPLMINFVDIEPAQQLR